jgi:hypothetical protein
MQWQQHAVAAGRPQRVPEMRPLQWMEDREGKVHVNGRAMPQPTAPIQQQRAASTTPLRQQSAQQPPSPSQPRPQRRPVPVRRGLTPDHYRHPLDAQNTGLLRALPGVEMVAKVIMGE